MWKGPITPELKELAQKYADANDGYSPDEYDEICYDGMPYERFVWYIREALRRHCCIVDVVWENGWKK